MRQTISIIMAGLVAIGILVTGGTAHAGLNNTGSTAFNGDNTAADGTVFYAVVYHASGVTLARANAVLGGTADLASAQTIDGGDAQDTDAKLLFLYQIAGATSSDVDDLFIKDFGFTPTSYGYFNDLTLDASGAITAKAGGVTERDPAGFVAGATTAAGDAAFQFESFGAGVKGTDEQGALVFATFDPSDASDTWALLASGQLSGGAETSTGNLPSPNPEPGSLALLGAAVAGFGGFRRFRRRRNAEQQPEETEADAATAPEVD